MTFPPNKSKSKKLRIKERNSTDAVTTNFGTECKDGTFFNSNDCKKKKSLSFEFHFMSFLPSDSLDSNL